MSRAPQNQPDNWRIIDSAAKLGLTVYGARRYCLVVTLDGRKIIDLSAPRHGNTT